MSYSEQLLEAIQNHDFSENNILLKNALNHDSDEILSSLAENLLDLGFSDMAKKVYLYLINQNPKEDLFKVFLAEILLNDGREDDGLTLLYNISKNSNAYVESLLAQADYYQSTGLIETAKEKLLKAKIVAPEEDAVNFGIAELAYLSGDYQEALSNYESLAKHSDSFGEIILSQRIAACLAQMGEYEQAAEIIISNRADILSIDSQYEAGLILLSAGKNKEAIDYLRQVIEIQPDYVNAYPLLAQAYANNNENELVLQTAQTGLSYNEFDETLYDFAAKAASNLNELDKAESFLKQGLKQASESSNLLIQLSNLYILEKEDVKNLNLFKKLDDDQIEPQAHWNIAVSNQRLENYDDAKSEYLLAYPSFQNNIEFLKQMISFFNEISEFDTAKMLIEKYLEIIPEDDEMQALLDDLNN